MVVPSGLNDRGYLERHGRVFELDHVPDGQDRCWVASQDIK